MKEAKYSIKDLEKLSGIKAHTLRIWEKRYELLSPERTTTNIRYYTDDDLRKILNVALLNRQGYKISHLAGLSDEALNEKVLSLSQNESLTDIQLDTLLASMIDLDEIRFDKIINKAIINYGFEETLNRIIYPLFERIGMLWQTGAINPAQEHFISNLIRQKVLVAIDGVMTVSNASPKTFFLFLREDEWHELGLLIFSYFIKKAGHKVLYFGQSLPFSGLTETSARLEPDFLMTILTCSLQNEDVLSYIHKLAGHFSSKTIFIAGYQVRDIEDPLPSNIRPVHSLAEFRQFLLSL
ncbi:MAG TPA: MerR family transcriptional regulator [Bacteroidales bacterium]|nr:MerR family transcriptional regulator [Bacteroidales bacterium]HSA42954.1 MerR family transcriptional regulator [Bacteroidales bacterium]